VSFTTVNFYSESDRVSRTEEKWPSDLVVQWSSGRKERKRPREGAEWSREGRLTDNSLRLTAYSVRK